MWIVANQLKGIVRFPSLGIEIPPEGEVDLDAYGRDRAERSSQIKLALDNAYLRTVRKTVTLEEADLERIIEERVSQIRREIGSMVDPRA